MLNAPLEYFAPIHNAAIAVARDMHTIPVSDGSASVLIMPANTLKIHITYLLFYAMMMSEAIPIKHTYLSVIK